MLPLFVKKTGKFKFEYVQDQRETTPSVLVTFVVITHADYVGRRGVDF